MSSRSARRKFVISEVVQTSGMDCGPAALRALLDGFFIPVSYGRLREACHTGLDGTSIDTVEDVANRLGLQAEQIMVPVDHVLLAEARTLPCVAVVRNAQGGAHFVVLWRRHGPLVQVMDPARGRLWMPWRSCLSQLVVHTTLVSADGWREWASSDDFVIPLRQRLRKLGLPMAAIDRAVTLARTSTSWRPIARLDAIARMLESIRHVTGVGARNIARAFDALTSNDSDSTPIPQQYWTVVSGDSEDGEERLQLRGAVLVRAQGAPELSRTLSPTTARSPELEAAVAEAPVHPLRSVFRALRDDGFLTPLVAAAALILAVVGVTFEAVLLRSVLDFSANGPLPEQALWGGAALVGFAGALLGLEWMLAHAERRIGGHLEGRLRISFFEKIPRLADAYFQSRPIADMLERSYNIQLLRVLPQLGVRAMRVALELVVITLAVLWLDPGSALWAAVVAALAVAIPVLGHTLMAERDLRVRTHAGALARFQLDALLGRTVIEAHGAEGAIEREHEGLLAEWAKASLALQRMSVGMEALQMVTGSALVVWMLFNRFALDDASRMLLLAYWLLNLPALGYELALLAREYPAHRSAILRLLEPLGAIDAAAEDLVQAQAEPNGKHGVGISLSDVHVVSSGQPVLQDIRLNIAPGCHVAIVGTSGAGKSTLVGLLLGWHRASSGRVLVDDMPLAGERLEELRRATAWVDPSVRLWNASLLDNIAYGHPSTAGVGSVLEAAGLLSVVARLPDGLATQLGEGGALLSAGEAQRVRIARAMLHASPRLVVLDEPFIGLERDRRRMLLGHIRHRWAETTLLYVTHDVAETRSFDRVLVVDRGRIVEDGDPQQLAQSLSSRYRRMLQGYEATQARLLSSSDWRRIRIDAGIIVQDHAGNVGQTA